MQRRQEDYVNMDVSYTYSLDPTFRTRRIVDGIGLQGVARRYALHLAPHALDLDIKNCQFVLMVQLLKRMLPCPALPEEVISLACSEIAFWRCETDVLQTRVFKTCVLESMS